MIPPLAAGSAMWFLTRSSGAVSLVLLTLSVILGIVNVQRWRSPRWPRFVTDGLHRNVSLLVLAFVIAHVITSVADSFAPVSLADAVIPFGGTYRPLWLGLGALSFDLLIALAVTSLLRSRVGLRTWRAIHWAAYACWPVALLHGLGTGSDTSHTWMLALTIACVVAVWLALWTRVSSSHPSRPSQRPLALASIVTAPIAVGLWLPIGPLGSNWARRSGTPAALLPKAHRAAGSAAAKSGANTAFQGSFNAGLNGTIAQSPAGAGLVSLDMPLRVRDPNRASLEIRIVGQPTTGGGVSMTSSRVTLGPERSPSMYSGRITSLAGTNVMAILSGPHGNRLSVRALLQIDSSTRTVAGRVESGPAGAQG